MRVLVCGGRSFNSVPQMRYALSKVAPDATLVHGAATGADQMAATIWSGWGREQEAHPAKWNQYGYRAGPIRNHEMLASGIDWVIALPGGTGTAHMVTIAREQGVPVWVVPLDWWEGVTIGES